MRSIKKPQVRLFYVMNNGSAKKKKGRRSGAEFTDLRQEWLKRMTGEGHQHY